MARDLPSGSGTARAFVELLRHQRRLVIVGHNHPDPDYLASALAIKLIAALFCRLPVVITMGGVLGRAENRAMVRLLKIKLQRLEGYTIPPGASVGLIDTQPHTGNNILPEKIKPLFVIDHHPVRPGTTAPFIDIRPHCGATSSILANYLRDLGVELPAPVATALTYGIVSETQDLGREAGPEDLAAYAFTMPAANKKHLAQIRHPRLTRSFYAATAVALQNAFYYRNIIGARLGEVPQVDVIPQMADLLLRHERMSWAICSGFYRDQLFISVRSVNIRARLGTFMRRLVKGRGTAGGHDMMAGAQVSCVGLSPAKRILLDEGFILDFFRRLTRKKEIEFRALLPRP